MMRSSWGPVLLTAGLLCPVPSNAQTVEHRESDSLEAPARANSQSGRKPDLKEVAALVLEGTNQFRRSHGRSPLKSEPRLTAAAQEFADYLARTDSFSHSADGRQPPQRAQAHGYDYCIVDENIDLEENPTGFTSSALARSLIQGWKNSPGHRRIMLDADVTEIGVGVAHSDKTDRYYAVQDFGRPKLAAIVFCVSNPTDVTARYEVDAKSFTLPPGATRIHKRCRPGDLEFLGAGDHGASDDTPVDHPTRGKRYVVQPDGKVGYRMVEGT
jgi:uncharacterized protein YkwD